MRIRNSPIYSIIRIVIPCTVYYGVNLLVSALFVSLFSAGFLFPEASAAESQALMQEYSYELTIAIAVITIPVMAWMMRRDRKRAMISDISREEPKVSALSYGMTAVLGVGACFAVNHLLILSGLTQIFSQDIEEMSRVLYQNHLAAEIIGVGCIVPIAEEMVFRGLTMRRLREVFGPGAAIVLSAAIFGLFHGNLLQGIYAFLIGLLLAWVYVRLGRITAPILLHASANLVSVIISDTDLLDFVYDDLSLFLAVTAGAVLLSGAALAVLYRASE